MPTYDAETLQQLIQRYQQEMMQRYASPASQAEPTAVDVTEPPAKPIKDDVTDETDIGSLQVRVSTENRAVPLIGAVVTVTRGDKNASSLVRTMVTDESGLTPFIDLPTKDRALSLSPGNTQPFTTYSIEVVADGYYPKKFTDIPVYGGVTAVQSVAMIPLPEGGDSDTVLVYPQGVPSVSQ